jgi:hypothetical protein
VVVILLSPQDALDSADELSKNSDGPVGIFLHLLAGTYTGAGNM